MIKKLWFIFFFVFSSCGCAHSQIQSLSDFSGLVDVIVPDKLKDNFAQDLLNVRTDDGGEIRKREGYQKYNNSALEGVQSIRKLYDYRKTDGSEYIIANSSWSCFANTSGNTFTSIVSGLNSNYTDSYATVNGILYRDNGYDGLGGKWDGTTYTAFTVANSTNLVSGQYIKWWHNRLWKAGVLNSPNYVYYSEAPNGTTIKPDDFNSNGFNYIRVDVDGGDIITGLVIGAGDRLFVTMRYKTFEIVENTAGSFILRLISPSIGCLYNTTVADLQGYPIWLSHRGVEQFDGSNFSLISQPIDNYVKALPQLTSSVGSWTQTTSQDWGAGKGVNIDTSTYDGSLTLATYPKIKDTSSTNIYYVQTSSCLIQLPFTVYATSFGVLCENDKSPVQDTYMHFYILTSTAGQIFYSTITAHTWTIGYQWSYIDLKSTKLNANTSYYFKLLAGDLEYIYAKYSSTNTIPYCQALNRAVPPVVDWTMDFDFSTDPGYGQFQSQVFSGSAIKTWSSMTIDQETPTGTNIEWYVSPATAAVLCSSSTLFKVDSPSYAITMSSPVPYIMFFASMTTTDLTVTPKINSVNINYIKNAVGTPLQLPTGITYKDRYYLFDSTDTSTNINNVALCFQKDNSWTIFNNIYAQSSCIYLDKLYTGSSDNKGQIYEMFVPGLYSDDGGAYQSYYTFKSLSMDNPITEKLYRNFWINSAANGNTLSLSYKLDDYPTWRNVSVPTTTSGIFTQQIPIPVFTKSYYLTVKVGNNNVNEDYRIKRLDIEYVLLQMR